VPSFAGWRLYRGGLLLPAAAVLVLSGDKINKHIRKQRKERRITGKRILNIWHGLAQAASGRKKVQ
jgi:hypothetical protein